MTPDIRPANRDDSEAIAALIRLCFATQSVRTDPPPSARLETAETIAARFDAGEGGVVAEDGDAHMLGVLLWAAQPAGLYVGRLSVHPDARRLGLARRLIGLAEQHASRLGLPRLCLSTRLPLLDNRRLFAACGFVETRMHAHPGYAAPTYVDMEKALG